MRITHYPFIKESEGLVRACLVCACLDVWCLCAVLHLHVPCRRCALSLLPLGRLKLCGSLRTGTLTAMEVKWGVCELAYLVHGCSVRAVIVCAEHDSNHNLARLICSVCASIFIILKNSSDDSHTANVRWAWFLLLDCRYALCLCAGVNLWTVASGPGTQCRSWFWPVQEGWPVS